LRRRLSEVGGATDQPNLHIPRRRTDANNDATNNADAIPVVDEERSFLAHEVRFRDKSANVRRLRELLAIAEEEKEDEKNQYIALLTDANPLQAAVFAQAVQDGNEDTYMEAVIRERQRTTMPRT
jgi:hypothetical protein